MSTAPNSRSTIDGRAFQKPAVQWRAWKQRLPPQLAQPPEPLEALRLRVAQLARANLTLRHQRDLLKKPLGIGSTT